MISSTRLSRSLNFYSKLVEDSDQSTGGGVYIKDDGVYIKDSGCGTQVGGFFMRDFNGGQIKAKRRSFTTRQSSAESRSFVIE